MSVRNTPRQGRFVTFEGIDGAGKSSQIAAASKWASQAGWELVCSREPGGTPLGEKLRELLLHEPMHLETEALLMFAARREHLAQIIEPALARGAFVLCDRFSDATYAYQHGGRGLDAAKFAALEQWVHPTRQPDLTFVFDVSPDIAAARLVRGRADADKFEREQQDFFQRVRQAYLDRAASSGGRIVVIDAGQSIEAVCAAVLACLQERFG
ncbi:MAG: dTMP kinase [Uliginosibacterium sp.]|jgi:dTMP kinase|nr:dTMP kinase [Uliginosibacterium sp.]MBK9616185.1 dTMP kinase [Uliginosibacterium sp.]